MIWNKAKRSRATFKLKIKSTQFKGVIGSKIESWNEMIFFSTNLVFLQKFELDGDVAAQPFILVSVDLVVVLSHLDAHHGGCVPRAEAQLLQVRAVGVKLKSGRKIQGKSNLSPSRPTER